MDDVHKEGKSPQEVMDKPQRDRARRGDDVPGSAAAFSLGSLTHRRDASESRCEDAQHSATCFSVCDRTSPSKQYVHEPSHLPADLCLTPGETWTRHDRHSKQQREVLAHLDKMRAWEQRLASSLPQQGAS